MAVFCEFMVFGATFNNIAAASYIVAENMSTRRKPPICHKSLTNVFT